MAAGPIKIGVLLFLGFRKKVPHFLLMLLWPLNLRGDYSVKCFLLPTENGSTFKGANLHLSEIRT